MHLSMHLVSSCLPAPALLVVSHTSCPFLWPGVDPLPAELQGQMESELLTAPFFIEAAVVLPQHGALLLADTGGWEGGRAGGWEDGWDRRAGSSAGSEAWL